MVIRSTDSNESQIKQRSSHMRFDGVEFFLLFSLHNEQ